MPRENRKRGKKHKKATEEDHFRREPLPPRQEEEQADPSWIVHKQAEEVNKEAPFGYVDAEVKAYFRTVDLQIREWQEQGRPDAGGDEENDPNEDRRLFLVAALTEMEGKEKQLATDPDCSTVLERMVYSMDDFVRRVFMDRLSGSCEQLATHRFASHVCQTMFAVAADTVYRESRGILPSPPDDGADHGELRTLTQLVLDACDELLPSLSSLVLDPFASHVVRALLLLLAPDCFPPDAREGPVRSKKSAAWKARQGPMKSVLVEQQAVVLASAAAAKSAPEEMKAMAKQFVTALREQLGENEVRALAADKVASPVLEMLLEIEAEYCMVGQPGSLMDRALVGMISSMEKDPETPHEPSDYLNTLLRDPTASHLFETLVRRAPAPVFPILWATYFEGKLARLAVHPVANFVVQKALGRLDADQLGKACEELADEVARKVVKAGRVGVLQALVDRAAAVHQHEKEVVELVCTAFALNVPEHTGLVVPCILRALDNEDYNSALAAQEKPNDKRETDVSAERPRKRPRRDADNEAGPMEPKVQGALLLQSLLRLSSPHNELVLHSLQALTIDELIEMAHHAAASRVLDVLLSSPTVPAKAKRTFVLGFMGRWHELVDDRIGSRVGERCWAAADGYMKEKIARSLMPHEHFLAGSFYGKFFARVLNLQLLKRNPDRWRDVQSGAGGSTGAQPTAAVTASSTSAVKATEERLLVGGTAGGAEDRLNKRKRKSHKEDEIDELFEATLGRKVKKAELKPIATDDADEKSRENKAAQKEGKIEKAGKKSKKGVKDADKDLQDVLGAIKAAPKDDKVKGKKGKKKDR
ncbi:hypothetical protein FOMPIDRAFT_1161063 [Fomitopsis schrenkii]|uniref:Nucleolar protein 9 n=1 Tax=Fomitopsis schrenkii TaxID=2126942 RepID=S8EA32_FOMSC|nr:hypothetical protein FOMPIDRAFT_1161063 [Fomitopsis schrenkii]